MIASLPHLTKLPISQKNEDSCHQLMNFVHEEARHRVHATVRSPGGHWTHRPRDGNVTLPSSLSHASGRRWFSPSPFASPVAEPSAERRAEASIHRCNCKCECKCNCNCDCVENMPDVVTSTLCRCRQEEEEERRSLHLRSVGQSLRSISREFSRLFQAEDTSVLAIRSDLS